MSSEDNSSDRQITRLKSVSWDGIDCPDGADCPTQWQSSWGTRITQGRLVTDPEVLRMLNLPPGEIAVETPDQLWSEP